ncbi:aminotransferase class I/II-fold pyridoxal phosphate-dependent enzyme [Streptococcus dentasini]
MAGWRIAFAVGNKDIIKLLEQYIRSSVGGTFGAVQDAASYALKHTREERDGLRRLYKERRQLAMRLLKNYDISVSPSSGTFFLWITLPQGWDDLAFANELLKVHGLAVVAGSAFGAAGRGHIRISLVSDTAVLRQGIEELGRFMNMKIEGDKDAEGF